MPITRQREQASYRIGGDASFGVSALAELRLPGFGVGGAVPLTIDVGLSLAAPIALEEAAAIWRDGLLRQRRLCRRRSPRSSRPAPKCPGRDSRAGPRHRWAGTQPAQRPDRADRPSGAWHPDPRPRANDGVRRGARRPALRALGGRLRGLSDRTDGAGSRLPRPTPGNRGAAREAGLGEWRLAAPRGRGSASRA